MSTCAELSAVAADEISTKARISVQRLTSYIESSGRRILLITWCFDGVWWMPQQQLECRVPKRSSNWLQGQMPSALHTITELSKLSLENHSPQQLEKLTIYCSTVETICRKSVRKNPLQRKFSVYVPSLHRDTETETGSTVMVGLWALECCFGFGIKKKRIFFFGDPRCTTKMKWSVATKFG